MLSGAETNLVLRLLCLRREASPCITVHIEEILHCAACERSCF